MIAEYVKRRNPISPKKAFSSVNALLTKPSENRQNQYIPDAPSSDSNGHHPK